MNRTLVIGDIHGGLKALQQVFIKAQITANDTLIFLGDYVDGWSESAQVIEFLIELDKKQPCVFIKGNHDAWCEEWLKIGKTEPRWLIHGGQATVTSYKNIKNKIQHLEFFERMLNYYVDEQNRLFIHAGFSSMHGPAHEMYQTNYSWDRTLWEMALTMDKRIQKDSILYPKRLKIFHEVYIGHTPTTNYNEYTPMNAINVWNIDTGAAFKGCLSVLDIDTKEFWQSEPVYSLYPEEQGRN